MDRAFKAAALGTPPVMPGSFSHGYVTQGDPSTSTPATQPGAWWFHSVTEELYGCLIAAGLTPDPANLAQLRRATMQFLQAGTGAGPRDIQAKLRDVVHIKDFLAVCDGVADDTAAIQAAATAAAGKQLRISGTPKITAAITLLSNTEVVGDFGAVIQTATPDISFLYATGQSGIKVRGVHFKQTVAANAAYVAGVTLASCTLCEVTRCEFEGMQWAGVFLDSSNDCTVTFNYFHDFLNSTAGDKSDICIYRNSSYNTVAYNRCYGGAYSWNGVLCQDPGGIGTYLPQHNKIIRNLVKVHANFGIGVYVGGSQLSYNEVVGNDIEGITGTANVANGQGIYCVGTGLGGLQVLNNNIRNCCISSTSLSNGPAGITIAGTAAGDLRPVVIGNVIDNMTQGHGIFVVSSQGGAIVQGNTVRMPAANNGTGVGGASLAGNGIKVNDSSDVTINANGVRHNGSNDAIFVLAGSSSFDRIVVTNNIARAVTANALRFDHLSTFVHTDVAIGGNQFRSDGASAIALTACDRVALTGNGGNSNTSPAVAISTVTNLRASNNMLNTNGTVGVTTAGACTGSFWDKTNSINGTFTNGATGLIREFFASAIPSTGTGAVGDYADQSVPVVGNSKRWRCTLAGAPGTWVSEGNL